MLTYPGDHLAPSRPEGAEPSAPHPPALRIPAPAAAPAVESRVSPLLRPAPAPTVEAVPVAVPVRQAAPKRRAKPEPVFVEPKGCLYALSQPPLMLFLCVVGGLIGGGAVWDMLFL
ncbi:hypothetical protein [Actinacidiphila sp. ITFR-21]|uniref:hypothetical protein n=1 Tax=Actinacidiphila sp. ITFR-21 TaxID=3075199 RepID=UPI00288B0E9E|nr:hypothetical protein [Streptomyces sp. ITFR-21]WNI14711.1 hypothetical protein RLT57_03560 [Streptomyces sp. ITFR-21]